MDYEKLRPLLPKNHTKWTTDDVAVWLKFIGLEALYPSFSKHRCELRGRSDRRQLPGISH